ncbi:MAG: ABC transporter permease [Clostridiales bacterium]|nr:ABC transporter permease [Clostridiales bacterium]
MKDKRLNLRTLLIDGSRILVLLVMFLVFTVFTDNFFGLNNLTNVSNILLQEAPFMMLLGLGMVVPMIVGGIDLSIGANISLSSFMCAMILKSTGSSVGGIVVGLAMGAFIGLLNGLMIAKIGLPPFVATYSMDWVAKGAVLVISKGGQITGYETYRSIFNNWRGTYLLISLVVLLVIWFACSRTTYGRRVYSVGSNPVAAKLSGMRADGIMVSAYVIGGLVAAVTGLMYIAKLGAAEPTLGNSFTMEAFAAALIGGASFTGAKSKISNALIGGLIMVVLNNGLIHIGVPGIWQDFAQGAVIIAAIVMERGLEKARVREERPA